MNGAAAVPIVALVTHARQVPAHLADRLLREPLERLGRDADGRTGRAIRHVIAL